MVKLPKLDPIGLPISLEYESIESSAKAGGRFVAAETRDIFTSTIELVQHITGASEQENKESKFPSKGRLENFNNPKGKSPEAGPQHARDFFARLQRLRQETQAITREKALKEEVDLGVSLPEKERNQKLNLSLDYKTEHTQNPYHITLLRLKLIEETKAQEEASKTAKAQETTPGINYFMQQNMAGERQGGQHIFNAAG